MIKEFLDVFPEEIPGLPPKREIDFEIELRCLLTCNAWLEPKASNST